MASHAEWTRRPIQPAPEEFDHRAKYTERPRRTRHWKLQRRPRHLFGVHAGENLIEDSRARIHFRASMARNAQFEYIHAMARRLLQRGQPVVSVDTKKKELVGEFTNAGCEWRPKGEPESVKVHDFLDPQLGKAIPYGVYDLSTNQGWVSVGIDHDTARFAAGAVSRWWKKMGQKRYPAAQELLIAADGGGSNGSRCRLWKVALQDLAVQLETPIRVCHFPPGTSKWNKIEHPMFCHITLNSRGRPLVSHEIIVQLIATTTTKTRLTIQAEFDARSYSADIITTDAELRS